MTILKDNAAKIQPGSTRRRLHVRQASMIDDKGTSYIWNRRIVRGDGTVIYSRPGRGKSTMGVSFAAHITNGWLWPDGAHCPEGDVLYIKGEGSDASIRERAELAGVNLSRFFVIGQATDEEDRMIDLAKDAALVAEVLEDKPGTVAIIIDTLDSLYSSMRMIDNANIRRCLDPMQRLAQDHSIALITMAHTNKGAHTDPLDRLSGGRAIGASARGTWFLGKLDPEADECFMASVKCNDFVPAPTISYRIVGDSVDKPGRIEWGQTRDDVSAWDLDGPPKQSNHEDKAEACKRWIQVLLADGPVRVSEVNTAAKAEGYGRRVMASVKQELDIRTTAQKGTFPPAHYMHLLGQCLPPSIDP